MRRKKVARENRNVAKLIHELVVGGDGKVGIRKVSDVVLGVATERGIKLRAVGQLGL